MKTSPKRAKFLYAVVLAIGFLCILIFAFKGGPGYDQKLIGSDERGQVKSGDGNGGNRGVAKTAVRNGGQNGAIMHSNPFPDEFEKLRLDNDDRFASEIYTWVAREGLSNCIQHIQNAFGQGKVRDRYIEAVFMYSKVAIKEKIGILNSLSESGDRMAGVRAVLWDRPMLADFDGDGDLRAEVLPLFEKALFAKISGLRSDEDSFKEWINHCRSMVDAEIEARGLPRSVHDRVLGDALLGNPFEAWKLREDEAWKNVALPFDAMKSIVGAMAAIDPAQALELVGASGDLKLIQAALTSGLDTDSGKIAVWAKANIDTTTKALISLSASDRNSAGDWISKLGEVSPSLLGDISARVPLTNQTTKLLGDIGIQLAKKDPECAIAFVNGLETGQLRDGIVGVVFEGLAIENVGHAQKYIERLAEGSKPAALGGVLRSVASGNIEAALAMAGSAPSSQQQNAFREVARVAAYKTPEEAAKILEDPKLSGILGNDFRKQMVDFTARTWGKEDMATAMNWVENLPAKDAPDGVRGLISEWTKNDPVAASKWLAALSPGTARDAGAKVLIEQIKNTDPQMAEQWRNSLSQQVTEQK